MFPNESGITRYLNPTELPFTVSNTDTNLIRQDRLRQQELNEIRLLAGDIIPETKQTESTIHLPDNLAHNALLVLYSGMHSLQKGSALNKLLQHYRYIETSKDRHGDIDYTLPSPLLHQNGIPVSNITVFQETETSADALPKPQPPILRIEFRVDNGIFREVNQTSRGLFIDVSKVGTVSGWIDYTQDVHLCRNRQVFIEKRYSNKNYSTNIADLALLKQAMGVVSQMAD